jgi:hypothetical protein
MPNKGRYAMPEFLYYILPPFAFAGVMFLLYKWLEIAGVTSALDFDIKPRSRTTGTN